jgi:hypothetical protein
LLPRATQITFKYEVQGQDSKLKKTNIIHTFIKDDEADMRKIGTKINQNWVVAMADAT